METIYMVLAATVLIVAIAVAFEWGYYRGMRDEIIQVKKADGKEKRSFDQRNLAGRTKFVPEGNSHGQSPSLRMTKNLKGQDDKMGKFQKGKQKKSPREEAEKARYDAILANIDNYTGDSKGQKEVISGGKEIL